MSYGLQCRRADGTLQFSVADDAAAFLEPIDAPAGAGTVTQQYPQHTGRVVETIAISDGGPTAEVPVTVSYPAAVPTVEVERSGGFNGRVFVMVL